MKKIMMLMILMIVLVTTSCNQNDADVASYNLSMAADNFGIERRIVFIDTWTDTYLLSITGLCSIKSAHDTTGTDGVAVTCKIGQNQYTKHYLGLSGNVTYFSEQLREAPVNVYRYKVVFKPSAIVPDIEFK